MVLENLARQLGRVQDNKLGRKGSSMTRRRLAQAFSVIEVTLHEGGPWHKWEPERFISVHAIKFNDGTTWDCYSGWRDKFDV